MALADSSNNERGDTMGSKTLVFLSDRGILTTGSIWLKNNMLQKKKKNQQK